MGDSQHYEVLSPEDADALKRELSTLSNRIDATKRKLILETKVRDATQSMSRLYPSQSREGSLDLPRPGSKGRGSEAAAKPTEDTLQSIRKCEELGLEIWKLESQQQQLQKRLLEHTAGVLQMTHKGYLKKEPSEEDLKAATNGYLGGHDSADFSNLSHYRPYSQTLENVDGADFAQQNQMIMDVERRVEDLNARLRDMILELGPRKEELPNPARELRDDPSHPGEILFEQVDFLERCLDAMHGLQRSRGVGLDGASSAEFEEQSRLVLEVEKRVEELNAQLRGMILDMRPQKEDLPNPVPELRDDPTNPGGILLGQVDFLERCLEAMEKLQENKRSLAGADEGVEEKLEMLNTQLFQTMTQSNPEKASKYTPPPEAMGDTLQDQLDYLEGGLGAIDRRLKQLAELADASTTKLASYQDRAEQYVSVVGGLWDILTAPDPRNGDPTSLPSDDDFSLTTFSAKVQEVHSKYVALQDQKDILTRQIQQQRELNETADTTKDTRMNDMREELEHTRAQLEKTSQEATSHLEKLTITLEELEALKRTLALRDQQQQMQGTRALEEERHDKTLLQQQLEEMRNKSAALEVNALALESELEIQTDNAAKADNALKEMEGEVARLQTELTIAKADLDSAHGTRAQRAAEAAGDPILNKRIQTLQKELSETISDYEAMTKATIEYEKEREQLESLADSLRDRIATLENQAADDRIQALGVKSPGAMSDRGGVAGSTGAAVLKNEFKKMMREARADHFRSLKVSLDK